MYRAFSNDFASFVLTRTALARSTRMPHTGSVAPRRIVIPNSTVNTSTPAAFVNSL